MSRPLHPLGIVGGGLVGFGAFFAGQQLGHLAGLDADLSGALAYVLAFCVVAMAVDSAVENWKRTRSA